jgi:transcriptional regulator with PAS, ATPase and Fis domain
MATPIQKGDCDELTGTSPLIRALQAEIEVAARCDAKILITGASGTGKEVTARQIHARSGRQARPFVAINCAGIPETLLESELFGHARGSFTGAVRDRVGLLETANHGTVFLDEIGEMSLRMQALLLRFLETGEIQRVGSERSETQLDVRIIAATNRDLLQRVNMQEFRLDLFYRLNVLELHTPALRDRPEDIPGLLEYFLRRYSDKYSMPAPTLTSEALSELSGGGWPGNVRELRNVAERLVVGRYGGPITARDLPREVQRTAVACRAAIGATDAATQLFGRMVGGGESFWAVIYEPYMARDLTRSQVRGMICRGLKETRGSYKILLRLFNMEAHHYKRLMNFLRKHDLVIDFREFREDSRPQPQRVETPSWRASA